MKVEKYKENQMLPFGKKPLIDALTMTGVFIILFVIGILALANNHKQSLKNSTVIEANQVDLMFLHAQQQYLEERLDSMHLLLFNTILKSAEADFKNNAENQKLLNELFRLQKQYMALKQTNISDNNFYFSKSQEGTNKKLKPNEFVLVYQTAFKSMFKKYNIIKPDYRTYRLIQTLSTAQAILESGWGGSNLAYYHNNWHGIKCQACGGVKLKRCTDKNSVAYNDDCEMDRFYKYSHFSGSIVAHYKLFTDKNKKYHTFINKALKKPALYKYARDGKITDKEFWASDVGSLCQDLSGYYATSKQYHNKLKTLIVKYKLY